MKELIAPQVPSATIMNDYDNDELLPVFKMVCV